MSEVLQERTETPIEMPSEQVIRLPVQDSLMVGVRPVGAVQLAAEFTIDCPELAQMASDQCRAWAHRIDQLAAMEKAFLLPLEEALKKQKATAEVWLHPAKDDLTKGRKDLLAKGLAWSEQEKARLAREAAEREALARKLRQEAEAKAAAERARAEEAARIAREAEARAEAERQKQAAEAERLRREGNAKAAAEAEARAKAAAAEQAKQQEKAAAAIENGNAKAQAMQMEAAAQVQAAPIAEVVQIKGQSTKESWSAELKPGVTIDQAKLLIVEAIAAGRHDLLAHLNLDTAPRGSLNKMASALKGAFNVPGFVAKATTTIAGSRK